MNLYFRLLWLLLTLRWFPKQPDPLAPTILNMRVMPNDLDIYGHVNNGRYLSLMDLGRLHLLYTTELLQPILKKKWAPLLGSVKIHFLKPLRLFQKFQLTTQTIYWDDKWIYIEQKFHRQDQLCAVALLKILFISQSGKVNPQDIVELLPHPPTKPPIPHTLKYWLEAEKASRSL